MSGSKAVVNFSNLDIEASNTATETSMATKKNVSAGAVVDGHDVSDIQGPTDVSDDARSHGIALIFMMCCLIMAVSLVASNATILGTVRVAQIAIDFEPKVIEQ